MPFLSPNHQCQRTEGRRKYHIPRNCSPQAHLGSSTLVLIIKGSWLPWGGLPSFSSALWRWYPFWGDKTFCKTTKWHYDATIQIYIIISLLYYVYYVCYVSTAIAYLLSWQWHCITHIFTVDNSSRSQFVVVNHEH